MKNVSTTADKTQKIVGMALFAAIVIVLQLVGSFIKFGMFSVSLVLLPIVVGAAIYGVSAGAWLGFVFAVAVLISGDAAAFLAVSPIGTVITVVLKGVLAGFFAGLTYRALSGVNKILAVFVSAIVCPIVNTGVFLMGCSVFFMELISEWAVGLGFGTDVVRYMFIGLAGGNFLFEMLFNIVLCPIIVRLITFKKA